MLSCPPSFLAPRVVRTRPSRLALAARFWATSGAAAFRGEARRGRIRGAASWELLPAPRCQDAQTTGLGASGWSMADGAAADAPQWESVCKVFDEELRGAGAAIRAVACTDSLVVTSSSRPVVKVWQVAEAGLTQTQSLSIVDSHGAVGSSCVEVAPASDGHLAAVCYDDGGIGLWDLRSGKRTTELDADIMAAWKAKFLPGGRRLVSGGPSGSVFFWELRGKGRLEREVGPRTSLAGGRAKEDLADPVKRRRTESKMQPGAGNNSNSNGNANAQHGLDRLAKPPSPIYSLAVSPDGNLLGCGRGSGAISVMRLDGQEWASDVGAHTTSDKASVAVRALSFDTDSRLVMSGGDDHHMCLFDAASWVRRRSLEARRHSQLERFSAHRGWVTSVSACPDPSRRVVVTTSWDGSVKLWDYCTHSLLHTYKDHTDSVFGSAFAPSDGRFFVSVGVDAQIVMYKAKHEPTGETSSRAREAAAAAAGAAKEEAALTSVKVKDGNAT